MNDRSDRWDLLIFETAEEYIARKEMEEEHKEDQIDFYLEKLGKDGCCEGECGGEKCRIVFGDMYLCYDCFYHSLECEGSVMVPMYGVEQMRDYVDEWEWDDLWYEENYLEIWKK